MRVNAGWFTYPCSFHGSWTIHAAPGTDKPSLFRTWKHLSWWVKRWLAIRAISYACYGTRFAIGSLELFSIDDLRFSYLDGFLDVSIDVSFQDFGAWEDLKDTLVAGIVDHCKKLFREKLIRISKRMAAGDAALDRSVDDVVNEQIREISR